MNRKLISLALSLGLTTCLVIAQEAQRPPAPEAASGAPRLRLLPRGAEQTLNLTGEQRNQMAAIETEARTKIEALLTPEQKEKLASTPSAPPPGAERNRSGGAGQHRPAETTDQGSSKVLASFAPPSASVTRVPVAFTGGHETLPVDHGRPVVLIAAALGVHDEVFREAFSHVHPAGPGRGGPTDAEARANKDALMSRLEQYGITNDRLNTVSNFYRYASWQGGIWRNQPAAANALVKDGAIVGFEIISGGYGYTTPPTVSVPGLDGAMAKVALSYGKDFETNGAVAAITLNQSR